MTLREMFDNFGRAFVFKQWREPLRQYLLKAGFQEVPYALFGVLFIVVVALSTLGFFASQAQINEIAGEGVTGALIKAGAALVFYLIVPSILIALAILAIYFILNMKIYARVKDMESVLPDYLQLVATNLKSGMNFEQSLWTAVRPEFGILSKEIALVSKRVMTGNDTAEALNEFVERYDSPTLRRNFNLIISEIQSGGEVVKVIERVIVSLKRTKDLKEEMSASVLNFMIFISIIVVVLSPVLFALANTLLGVVLSFAKLLGNSVGNGSSLGSAGSMIKRMASLAENADAMQASFRMFSYWALGLIAFFSSMIVSIIEKGDIRGGIKYIPLFTVTALVLFGIFVNVFSGIFSGIF
jgi:archaeal flagellar protein FlaJ